LRSVALEESELFHVLGDKRLAQVRSRFQLCRFRVGEYLYFESQNAAHLWVVRAGEVRTLRTSAAGRITALEHLRPGELFGMAAGVGSPSYTESAQGIVAGEAWRVPREFLSKLIEQEPELGRGLLAVVASRLQAAHDRLCSFAHDNVPARLSRAVLEEAEGERIEMTRRALSESVGTTVETAIRVLRGFEREGWIEGGLRWIRIVDRNALEAVARSESPKS